jgi:hypothetical protein
MTRVIERAKTKTVHCGNGPSTHRKDVAQNSAYPCGCSLKWLDERRMIVGFDLKGGAPVIADIDYSRIFAGRDNYALAGYGQTL